MAEVSLFDVVRLRDWNTLRAFLYVLVPVVVTALGVSNSPLWIGLVLAVLAPTLSMFNTESGFRTWFYGVLAAGQTLVLGLDLLTDVQVSLWLPVIGAIVGGGVATGNLAAGDDA